MFNQTTSTLGRMVEIDWNSLFSNFFRMVRIKVACKDASKIPSKRLFEMRKNMYVIRFKVEGMSNQDEEDGDGGSGEDDQAEGDDQGIEELDHEMDLSRETPKPQQGGSGNSGQNSGMMGGSGSCKKVATWASLFQGDDISVYQRTPELGHYSCARLLREMETIEAEEDEDDLPADLCDAELVTLSASWCEKLSEVNQGSLLPSDLFHIPELEGMDVTFCLSETLIKVISN
jgi:hypothetical protein